MIDVERRQVVTVTAPERGVFLEQSLLDVEPEVISLVILVVRVGLLQREFIHLAVAEQNVIEGSPGELWFLVDQLLGPDFLDLEAF